MVIKRLEDEKGKESSHHQKKKNNKHETFDMDVEIIDGEGHITQDNIEHMEAEHGKYFYN